MKKRILVVDDNKAFTSLFSKVMKDYDVMVENNPRLAIQTARHFRPDLIFLDIMFPDFDGGDLSAAIKGDPVLEGTPVVFLTGLVSPLETHHHSILIHGLPFLSKPIGRDELSKCIEEQTSHNGTGKSAVLHHAEDTDLGNLF